MVIASIITDLTGWLEDVSAEWWFLLVILGIAFLDSVIPIVPSETTVILGGVAAGAGDQNLLLVILAGAVGAFLGDNTAYLIGRRFKPLIERRAARREKTARRLEWASDQIRERGGLLLITARFIPGGRTALTITCGLTHQPWAWFAAWVAIATTIWASYAADPRLRLRQHVRGQPHAGVPPRLRRRAVGDADHRGRPPPAQQVRRARREPSRLTRRGLSGASAPRTHGRRTLGVRPGTRRRRSGPRCRWRRVGSPVASSRSPRRRIDDLGRRRRVGPLEQADPTCSPIMSTVADRASFSDAAARLACSLISSSRATSAARSPSSRPASTRCWSASRNAVPASPAAVGSIGRRGVVRAASAGSPSYRVLTIRPSVVNPSATSFHACFIGSLTVTPPLSCRQAAPHRRVPERSRRASIPRGRARRLP